jgi:hypothetical protein
LEKLYLDQPVTMGILGYHHLDPVVEPIALFEQFVAKEPQTLVLKEKVLSVSGDSFDIKLANGETLLKVHGTWVSLSGRKKVEDVHGKHLFDIVKEHLHIHSTYAIEDAHRKKICEVKSSLKCKCSYDPRPFKKLAKGIPQCRTRY